MFYVSSKKGEDLYGITDSDDKVEEFYTINQLSDIINSNSNLNIQGVIIKENKIYITVVKSMETAKEMAKRLLVDSIYKSANLEGLGTTFPKTESILENIPTETSRDEVLFIINMKKAWNFLLDTLNTALDLSYLRQLNHIVSQGIFNGGNIRTSLVTIGGTSWVPDLPNNDLICQELEYIKSIKNMELRALKSFCYVARTQMFIDGNKRVAQLVANKILIESNIGIFQVKIEDLERFKTLLLRFYETNNDNEIINFMLKNCIVRR